MDHFVLEKQIEARLVKGVKALGGRAYKWVSPGNIGVPDRVVVLPGGHVEFVELKTERGRLSKSQIVQIERLSKLDQHVSVLYGAEEVDRYLKEIANEIHTP